MRSDCVDNLQEKVLKWASDKHKLGIKFNLSLSPLELMALSGIILLARKHPDFRQTSVFPISSDLINAVNQIFSDEGFNEEELISLNTAEVNYNVAIKEKFEICLKNNELEWLFHNHGWYPARLSGYGKTHPTEIVFKQEEIDNASVEFINGHYLIYLNGNIKTEPIILRDVK